MQVYYGMSNFLDFRIVIRLINHILVFFSEISGSIHNEIVYFDAQHNEAVKYKYPYKWAK